MLTWMRTYTGRRVDFLNPDPKSIHIEDIAQSLSRICRFNGHTHDHYSVAQHSIYVSQVVARLASPGLALAGLLHDAPEAYVGDVISPLKAVLTGFDTAEARIARAIETRFGVLFFPMAEAVKRADLILLVMEAESLLGVDAVKEWGIPPPPDSLLFHKITPWPAELAKRYFLKTFDRLMGEYSRALVSTYKTSLTI